LNDRITDIAGAILAGGKNTRMGGVEKSFIKINGIPIIERTINLLNGIFDEILIITNKPENYIKYKNCLIVTDIIKDIGPLGAVLTAINRTSKPAVFCVACDMPFLDGSIISRQLSYFKKGDFDALVPRIGEFIEPLHAIYAKRIEEKMLHFVKRSPDLSIRRFLREINVGYWELEDNPFHRKVFKNLNTIEDVYEIGGQLK
jgi:molybdopterin-guanine dinucleotide biosynthesis protein A